MSKKPPLSADDQDLLRYKKLRERILGMNALGRIKSRHDLLNAACYPLSGDNSPVSKTDVLTWLEDRKTEIQNTINERHRSVSSNPNPNPVVSVDPVSNGSTLAHPEQQRQQAEVKGSELLPPVSVVPVHSPAIVHAPTETKTEREHRDIQTYLLPSPKQKAILTLSQQKAAAHALRCILEEHKRGLLVIGKTGDGKTFVAGGILRQLVDRQFALLKCKSVSLHPIVYVTAAPVVVQTQRVLEQWFGLSADDVLCINIEQLRSDFGKLFVREILRVENGEEIVEYKWRANLEPVVILLDECHKVKNTDSAQSKIMQSYNDLANPNTFQLFTSATPFTRVCEAKCWVVACRVEYTFKSSGQRAIVNNSNWKVFAAEIAHPAEPEDYVEAAVERLMTFMHEHVIKLSGARWQFKGINSVVALPFESVEDEVYYAKAYERYLKKKAELGESGGGAMEQLVALLVFGMAAELCKVKILARRAHERVQNGKAAVIGVRHKTTIIRIVQSLVNDYGYSRNKISLIWGGGQTEPTKRQKLKAALTANENVLESLAKAGVTMEDLDLEDVEAKAEAEVLDESLRLGVQSRKQRQEEIDRFQSGRSHICIFTFKSGSTGLSLHHSDEQTKQKVRRTPTGWAVVEDIPLIPIRQREVDLTAVWSGIEMVQGVGRVPRLTSLSDSHQFIVVLAGTVEEHMVQLYSRKLRSLKKVIGASTRENWEDVIASGGKKEVLDEKLKQITEEDLDADVTEEAA